MLYIKSISTKKVLKAKTKQILFQVQLFKQTKQYYITAVEITNYNWVSAETMLNLLNQRGGSLFRAIPGQEAVIQLEVL